MKLLFIIDPPASLKAYKDTTVAMMRAAQKRGHEVFIAEQHSLRWRGTVGCAAQRIALGEDDDDWYWPQAEARHELTAFDAVLMRKDPPFDLEYMTSTWLLSQAERDGARVWNKPTAVRDHNEKLGILEFPQFVAPTLATREPEAVQAFIDEHRDVVLKRLDGMGGESIFRVRHDDPNRNVIVEHMTSSFASPGTRSTMAQRYIPGIKDGDKRILLIGGKPVPYALARLAKPGESRANLAAGGRGEARELSAHDRRIAETLAPTLWARGLLLVGLDVIGENLTEVNVTSPTCFREIQDQTGFDVSGMFIEAVERESKGKAA